LHDILRDVKANISYYLREREKLFYMLIMGVSVVYVIKLQVFTT